jgi:hypothetical protein
MKLSGKLNPLFITLFVIYLIAFFLPSYKIFLADQNGYDSTVAVFYLFELVNFNRLFTQREFLDFLSYTVLASPNILLVILLILRFSNLNSFIAALILSVIILLAVTYWFIDCLGKDKLDALKVGYWMWTVGILGICMENLWRIRLLKKKKKQAV